MFDETEGLYTGVGDEDSETGMETGVGGSGSVGLVIKQNCE
jgi:hypothetical protein